MPSQCALYCEFTKHIMDGIVLPSTLGANKTALNCLTNICMSLSMLLNTLLSN